MKIQMIAASAMLAVLVTPLAALAGPRLGHDVPGCGVPQGYGTSNPSTFNGSTCPNGSIHGGGASSANNTNSGMPQGDGTGS